MTPAQERVEEAVSVLERMERIKTQYPDANWGKETEAALVILAELRRLRTQAEGMREALDKCLDEIACLPDDMKDLQMRRVFKQGEAALRGE